jgi:hypothetical protein
VAYLAEVPYREAFAAVELAAQRRIRSLCSTSELIRALAGYRLVPEPAPWARGVYLSRSYALPKRRALRHVVAEVPGRALVRVGGHFVALQNGRLYDNSRFDTDPGALRWLATHVIPVEEQRKP